MRQIGIHSQTADGFCPPDPRCKNHITDSAAADGRWSRLWDVQYDYTVNKPGAFIQLGGCAYKKAKELKRAGQTCALPTQLWL